MDDIDIDRESRSFLQTKGYLLPVSYQPFQNILHIFPNVHRRTFVDITHLLTEPTVH